MMECPFVIVGHQVQECCNGLDRHRARKKKDRSKQADHDYCGSKSRTLLQPSKKMNYPAAIHIRSVVRFPTFEIERNSEWAKHRQGKRLHAALENEGEEICWEHRIYLTLPGLDAHRNHFVDDVSICVTRTKGGGYFSFDVVTPPTPQTLLCSDRA